MSVITINNSKYTSKNMIQELSAGKIKCCQSSFNMPKGSILGHKARNIQITKHWRHNHSLVKDLPMFWYVISLYQTNDKHKCCMRQEYTVL